VSDSQPIVQPNDPEPPPARTTYRYPAAYRAQALFGAALFGLIVIGSALAEVEAIQNSRPDAVLPVVGFVSGLTVLLLSLDIGTCTLATTEDGLQVKGLRASTVPWSDVLGWRYLPLSLIHIRLKRGPGLFVWPILERYNELLATIDERVNDRLTGNGSTGNW
jgi:hypothetical protein